MNSASHKGMEVIPCACCVWTFANRNNDSQGETLYQNKLSNPRLRYIQRPTLSKTSRTASLPVSFQCLSFLLAGGTNSNTGSWKLYASDSYSPRFPRILFLSKMHFFSPVHGNCSTRQHKFNGTKMEFFLEFSSIKK